MKINLIQNQIPDKEIIQKNPLLLEAAKYYFGETIPQKSTFSLRSNLRAIYISGKIRMPYITQLKSYYNFPDYVRWDYGHSFFGVSIFKPFEIYNKNVVFYQPRKRLETKFADPEKLLTSLRQRMWCIASCLVFPLLLSEITIKETKKDEIIFRNKFNDEFIIKFDEDTNQLKEVSTFRYGMGGDFENQSKYTVNVENTESLGKYNLPNILIGKWEKEIAMIMRIREIIIGRNLQPIMFAAIRK